MPFRSDAALASTGGEQTCWPLHTGNVAYSWGRKDQINTPTGRVLNQIKMICSVL